MNLDRRHRPRDWSQLKGNENAKNDILSLLRVGDMPHIMLVGPPGTGKTTVELLIASTYLGRPVSISTEKSDPDFIVYNGSDERGLEIVRKDIKIKAKSRSQTYKDGERLKRIIAMREIDNMTKDAQHSLRDIIEVWEHNCLFIFTLNRIGGIEEPALISRCAIFFFKRPTPQEGAELFLDICEKEGVVLEDKNMALDVAKYYKGDLRHMLNDCLEALRGYPNPITKDNLWKVYKENATSVAERVYKSVNPRQTFFDIFKTEGFSVRDFLDEYYDLLGDKAIKYSKAFAETDARLRDKCSESIQMGYFFTMLGV